MISERRDYMKNHIRLFSIIVLIIFILTLGSCTSEPVASNIPESSNKITMPNVMGLSLEEALNELSSSGFQNIGTDREYDEIESSRVIVAEQSISEGSLIGPTDKIGLVCKILYKLTLDIKSDYNLIFNKYDVEIFADDTLLGTVSNGETFTESFDILEGTHKLWFYKEGKHETNISDNIVVKSDLNYKCTVMHDSDMSLTDIEITEVEPEDAKASMIGTLNMALSEAKTKLLEIGFTNIKAVTEYGEPIEGNNDWYIVSQSIASGTDLKTDNEIILTCKKIVNLEEPTETKTNVPKAAIETVVDKDLMVLNLRVDPNDSTRYFVSFAEVNDRGAIIKSYCFPESIEPEILGFYFKDNKLPDWFKDREMVHVRATLNFNTLLTARVTKVMTTQKSEDKSEAKTPEPTIIPPAAVTEPETNKNNTNTPKNSKFEIYYLDVGQGDAAVILCDGHAMMIDGGPSGKSDFIYSFLKSHGITHLDYIIASHPDADHVGGLSGALNYASADRAFCTVTAYDTKTFNNFVKYLGEQNLSITVPFTGDEYSLGSASFKIVGPVRKTIDGNLVIRIKYGDTSFLFTGDTVQNEENEIINSGYDIESTVLKVAHHGSDSSTGYYFLRTVWPKFAVISVGGNNTYGHPTDNVLSRLRDADVKCYRTDMNGTIHCVSDGKKVTFDVEKNKELDPFSNAGGYVKKAATAVAVGSAVETVPKSSKNEQQSIQNFVLNKNTKKVHVPDCRYVNTIKDKNRWDFSGTVDDIPAEYNPCDICRPY